MNVLERLDLNTRLTTAEVGVRTIGGMFRTRQATRSLPRRLDVVVVLALVVLVLVGTSQVEVEPTERPVDGLAFACGVVAAASLVLWRRWPVAVAAVVSVAIGVYLGRRYPPGPVFLPGPLAMFALGFLSSRRVAWLGVGSALAIYGVGSVAAGEDLIVHLLFFCGWAAAGVLAGQVLAARGERAAAERERIAHARDRALASERLRIAQDLHDSVAHAMATINVQSGVAAHLVEHKPEQAGVALEAIRAASGDVLDQLGVILGVLRDSDDAVPLAPLGGLAEIGTLVDRAREDGLSVELDQSGDLAAVSSSVGAAAYRAVQEALTNTLRHAGPTANASVRVAVSGSGSVHVAVADDGGQHVGQQRVEPSGGFGLVGMRERIEATGGSLVVGPTDSGGFGVEAVWQGRVPT